MKKISLFLALCMLMSLLPMSAYADKAVDGGECGEKLTWSLTAEGVLTISGEGEMDDSIPWYDYCAEDISSVVIADGATSICAYAFYNCGRLTDISIPNTVKSVGDCAFYGCSSLTDLDIPESVTSMGSYVFYCCGNISNAKILCGISAIGDYAFYGCGSLENIAVPSSVKSIGKFAFCGCGELKTISIPGGVTDIADNAFKNCGSLKEIAFGGAKAQWDSLGYTFASDARVHYNCTSLENHYTRGETVKSTCQSDGYTVYACQCGYSYKDDIVPAGHDYKLVDTFKSTCTEHGYDLRRCDICGNSVKDYYDDALLPHSYVKTVVSAACVTEGYTNYVCTSCGDTYKEDIKMPLGHTETEVANQPASCTEAGYNAGIICSECGETISGMEEIPALGHDYQNGVCTRCGDVVVSISKQPESLIARSGSTGKFVVNATGDKLSYQWQYQKTDSSTWTNSTSTSGKTDTLSVNVREAIDGYKYRCKITDASGNSVMSSIATLTVTSAFEITMQPSNLTAQSGKTGKFTVTASGDGLKYQWQYQKPGTTTWVNSTAASGKTASFTVNVREAINGYKYRCKVTDASGSSITSSIATLTVTPGITKQPANIKVQNGTTGKLTITAAGDGLSYQWQYQKPGTTTWVNSTASSGKTASFSINAREAIDGYKYRCVVKNSCGNSITSSVATLTVVYDLAITKQPTNLTAASGTTGKLKITAVGTGLSYQWQYQKPGTTTWVNSTASSGKTASFSINVREAIDGYKYRCIVKDALGDSVISNTVKLTVT